MPTNFQPQATAGETPPPAAIRYLSVAEAESAARDVALELLATAQRHDDGSIGWGRGTDRDRQPIRDAGPFSGRSGEGLFLAALHAATGDEVFRDAARRVLDTLVRKTPDAAYREHLSRRLPTGLTGLGGLIYVLVRAGGFLGDAAMLEAAARLARALTPERIAEERHSDFVWGHAGAVLGLLALAETAPGERSAIVHQARLCADHLLHSRTPDPASGLRAWTALSRMPTTGFAHGASGIVQALLQLYRVTGETPLYDAACEALAFERTLWNSETGNVLDSGAGDEQASKWGWGWCHGAPGLIPPRLTALDLLEPEDELGIAEDLGRALRATAVAEMPGTDSICCGWFGRIDILFEAGRVLGNPSLVDTARRLAHLRLVRARADEGFAYSAGENFEPHQRAGMWQGAAGTAYVLLRLAHPDLLPSILRMA